MGDGMKIKITTNGPLMVIGGVPLKGEVIKRDSMGRSEKWEEVKSYYRNGTYPLCRCGKSTDKPFCTGDHIGWDGTETAKRNTFEERAKAYPESDGIVLLQDPALCDGSGFCHGIHNINQTAKNKKTLETAKQQVHDCASGSIVMKVDGQVWEPKFEKSISVTGTPGKKGPFWVKGGVPLESADGYTYEVRNRMTLCGCGKSKNKPFCDGAHKN
ncbi:iron-binding zinc finger CDGSH type [Candidatus Methanoplasma termitum]|uniref:Iron-binding zinc finger CDGSH type n=1 Tax=Candidatus Methanoplasma termitum TaxID=1577791 RepID=A0A0A7LAV0_9ARCH|nr:CDGSH iron-sulfur domain-containing protein [Candidatus Methanoplasma termitum]AIZ56108.1 iron-binding zinc finger CDGSH type [Candidatus Methanoplasma termitum]MCL2334367.1 CDGSH iron-sulfur domain-containing protein [Candidatus Methanoplasma sp.]